MTDKQFDYIIKLSEQKNTTKKHKELFTSSIQQSYTAIETDFLIKDLQNAKNQAWDVFQANKQFSENPEFDANEEFTADPVDWHARRMKQCINKQEWSDAAIHMLTIKDLANCGNDYFTEELGVSQAIMNTINVCIDEIDKIIKQERNY